MPIASRTTCPTVPAPIRMSVAYSTALNAVRRRSDVVSEAVSPANNATLPIGSMVVQTVAKSLLILINRGDMDLLLMQTAASHELKSAVPFESTPPTRQGPAGFDSLIAM